MKKNFVRIFSLVLAVVLVLGVVAMGVVAMAAAPDTLYFKPGEWTNDSARIAAYFFEGATEAWVTMTDSDGDGIYECAVPGAHTKVIFVRMNPAVTTNSWDAKWNQTADLTIPTDGKNCFTVNAGEWDNANGTWSTIEVDDNTCEHVMDFGSTTTAATCTTAGVTTYTCTLCGYTKTESIPALGHSFVDGTCSVCGAVKTMDRVIYFVNTDNWSTVNAYAWNTDSNEKYLGTWPGSAMTLVEGETTLYSITVSGDATHIIFNNGSAQTDDLELSTEYNCYDYANGWDLIVTCDHAYIEEITTDPTCDTEGVKTFTCGECGHTYTEAIAALGHSYTDGVCSVCGKKEPCTTHSWDEGVVTTEATCTSSGVKTYSCANCDETKTETILSLGHNMVDGTCTRCGEADTCSHRWFGGTTVSATCETDGSYTETCLFCKAKKVTVIPAKGHKYAAGRCYVCGKEADYIEFIDIATAADLIAFANRVNAGETTLNARLIADIDLGGATWTPIGQYCPNGDSSASLAYQGRFEGNGHTISNFTVAGNDSVGLIGYAEMALIQNLGVINATATGANAGAIIGNAATSTIINCFAINCTITGYTTNAVALNSRRVYVGAVAGQGSGYVYNCYAVNCTIIDKTGDMTIPAGETYTPYHEFLSAPVGGNGSSISNNYYYNVSGTFYSTAGATEVTAAQMNSGEVAYKLQGSQTNAVWGQEIGKDAYPVIFGKTVYFENGVYTNDGTPECSHSWLDATCTAPKTCSVCGETEGEALGHGDLVYSFVDNTHTFTCTVCNEVVITKASTDGKQLKFRSAAPLLGDCINVEFGIEVPAGFENVYVVFDFIGKQTRVDSYYVNAAGRYVFEFPGINPQTIGENIRSTVYATVDGVEVSLTYATYSVRTYCGNQLTKTTVSAALKTLIADLLIFGEKTQIVQNYKTDELITAGMDLTPYASTFPGLGTEFNKQAMVGTANSNVGFKSVTLTLSGKMTIVVSLTADDISKYTFQAEVNGVVTTYQPEDLVYNATNGRYELSFDKMKASAFDDVITFSILENGVVTSKQLQYTVNTYIQKNQSVATGDMLALLQAIYNYGAAAKALNG